MNVIVHADARDGLTVLRVTVTARTLLRLVIFVAIVLADTADALASMVTDSPSNTKSNDPPRLPLVTVVFTRMAR